MLSSILLSLVGLRLWYFQVVAAALIAIGSPDAAGSALEALPRNAALERWDDFRSDQDWMCTDFHLPRGTPRFIARKLKVEVSLGQMVSGESHNVYFHCDPAMELMLAPFPAQLEPA
jgi:hypothetical protein